MATICNINFISEGNIYPKNKLPECKYGKNCYRKNPFHFEAFQHQNPALIKIAITHNEYHQRRPQPILRIRTYEELITRIEQICDLTRFQFQEIYYFDIDNDKIKITSTEEWLAAIEEHEESEITLYFKIRLLDYYRAKCSNCEQLIPFSDKHYFKCNQCIFPYLLCSSCENRRYIDLDHLPFHAYLKMEYQNLASSPPQLSSPLFPPINALYGEQFKPQPINPLFNNAPQLYSIPPPPLPHFEEKKSNYADNHHHHCGEEVEVSRSSLLEGELSLEEQLAALELKIKEEEEKLHSLQEKRLHLSCCLKEQQEEMVRKAEEEYAAKVEKLTPQLNEVLDFAFWKINAWNLDVEKCVSFLIEENGNVDAVVLRLVEFYSSQ